MNWIEIGIATVGGAALLSVAGVLFQRWRTRDATGSIKSPDADEDSPPSCGCHGHGCGACGDPDEAASAFATHGQPDGEYDDEVDEPEEDDDTDWEDDADAEAFQCWSDDVQQAAAHFEASDPDGEWPLHEAFLDRAEEFAGDPLDLHSVCVPTGERDWGSAVAGVISDVSGGDVPKVAKAIQRVVVRGRVTKLSDGDSGRMLIEEVGADGPHDLQGQIVKFRMFGPDAYESDQAPIGPWGHEMVNQLLLGRLVDITLYRDPDQGWTDSYGRRFASFDVPTYRVEGQGEVTLSITAAGCRLGLYVRYNGSKYKPGRYDGFDRLVGLAKRDKLGNWGLDRPLMSPEKWRQQKRRRQAQPATQGALFDRLSPSAPGVMGPPMPDGVLRGKQGLIDAVARNVVDRGGRSAPAPMTRR